jgi:aminoglycoside phosphotransferase (APT) family kinase protein
MPTIVPDDVLRAIASALGVAQISLAPLLGGTNGRTYHAHAHERQWVVRVEQAPALSLHRAVTAQTCASAARVRTPVTIAHDVTETAHGSYVWSTETIAAGEPWLAGMEVTRELRAASDLGRQLRRLHAVTVDAFGDLPPRPYPVYPSFAAWVENKARRIAPAVTLAGGDPEQIARVASVYTSLASWYDGPPCLCKGDCAGGNLIVDERGHVTMIDWEWAQGLDPAADIAFWCNSTADLRMHAALLDAYEPPSQERFQERVWAHQVVQCVETIHVFDEHRHAFDEVARAAGIEAASQTLGRLLACTSGD